MTNFFPKKFLVLILFIGLVIRVIYVFKFSPKSIDIPSGDAVGYNTLAKNLLYYGQLAYEKDKLTAHREPGYPIFLFLVYKIFGESLILVRILQSISSVVSIYFIFFIARKIFGDKEAVISSAIACFWPTFIYYSAALLRETLFTFWLLLCMIFVVRIVKDGESVKLWDYIFIGIFFGVGCLINSVMVVVVICLLTYFVVIKINWKRILLVSLIFCITYSGWVIRNYKVFGKFVLASTNGGKTFWDGTDIIPFELRGLPEEKVVEGRTEDIILANKIEDEIERDKFFYRKTFEYIKNNPRKYIKLVLTKFFKFWRVVPHKGRSYGVNENFVNIVSVVFFLPVLVFCVVGIFFSFNRKESIILILPILGLCAVYSVFWSQVRYRLPIEPYLIIFSSSGVVELYKMIFHKK